ncbi:MAG: hypothetical protein MZU79_04600 [Anaerotruncus sp.]|nr:hypothetical protein [Anaerotruncus sp.]
MNRPGQGLRPGRQPTGPSSPCACGEPGRPPVVRVLEGPLPLVELRGQPRLHGRSNHGLPRFRDGRLRRGLPARPGAARRPRRCPSRPASRPWNPLVPARRRGERAAGRGPPRTRRQHAGRGRSRPPSAASLPNFIGHRRLGDDQGLEGRPVTAGPPRTATPSGTRPPRRASS